MAEPTIAARLERKYVVISGDERIVAELKRQTPAGWGVTETTALDELGEFHEILLHRFLLLDLDETTLFDPIDIVREIRTELLLNIPIFCFGGSAELRDEARLNRADRFFERDEIVDKMLVYCEQYGWGR